MTAVQYLIEHILSDTPKSADEWREIFDKALEREDDQVMKYISSGKEYLEWKNEKRR